MTDTLDPLVEYKNLLSFHKSSILSTVDRDGDPLSSYAPHALDNENFHFYISISGMAAHTKNIEENGKVSLMIIQDESAASKLFARKRVIFHCHAEVVNKASEEFIKGQDLMIQAHGDFIKGMLEMPDFRLIKISPKRGNLVLDFGKAYQIAEDLQTLKHRSGGGHGRKN